MSLHYIIIGEMANLFRIYIIRKFIRIFFENIEVKQRTEWAAYGLFYILTTVLYWGFQLSWLNLFSNVVGLFMLTLIYSKGIKMNLFISASIFITNMICDNCVFLLLSGFNIKREFNQIYEVIIVFMFFVCEIAVDKIIKFRKTAVEVNKLPLLIIPVTSIFILAVMVMTSWDLEVKMVVTAIGLLLINFLIFFFYNMLLESLFQKYEKEMLQQKVNTYANQIDVILQTQDKMKRLQHDMIHHINEVKILAMRNDADGVSSYIDQMAEFMQNPNEVVSSGNMEIDSLLNYLIQSAKEKLNTVNVKVRIPENMNYFFDINIILGNLMENAIEAAGKTKEKTLDAYICLKQGVLRIEIINSCVGELLKRKGRFLTTKKEKENHGIGLSSVKKIVEKYNGEIDIYSKNNTFHVNLILYMPRIKDQ